MVKMKGSSMTNNNMTHEQFVEWENKKWGDIKSLPREELLELLMAYDAYVWEIINENQGEPVGVCEFYEYDYKDYVKGK